MIDDAFLACATAGFSLPVLGLVFWFVTRGPRKKLSDREVSKTLDQTTFRLSGRAREKLAEFRREYPNREPRLVVQHGVYRLALGERGGPHDSKVDGVWVAPDVMSRLPWTRVDWVDRGGGDSGFKIEPAGPPRDSLALIEEPGRGLVPKLSRAGGPYYERSLTDGCWLGKGQRQSFAIPVPLEWDFEARGLLLEAALICPPTDVARGFQGRVRVHYSATDEVREFRASELIRGVVLDPPWMLYRATTLWFEFTSECSFDAKLWISVQGSKAEPRGSVQGLKDVAARVAAVPKMVPLSDALDSLGVTVSTGASVIWVGGEAGRTNG